MTKRQAVRLKKPEDFNRLKTRSNVIESHAPYNLIVFQNPEGIEHNYSKVASVTDGAKGTIETGLLLCHHKLGMRDQARKWLEDNHYIIVKRLPHLFAVDADKENTESLMATGLFSLVEPDEISTGVGTDIDYTDDFYATAFYFHTAGVPYCWSKVPELKHGNIHVIDGHGMDITHEDIFENIAGSWDAVTSTTNIMPVNPANEKHMYACAGVAGARTNNSLGVASVGGNRFGVYPHRVGWNPTSSGSFQMSGLTLESALAKVLTDPKAIAVSMSFGGSAKYPGVQLAIDNLRTLGRGGKGIPVFASSGNSGNANFSQYPAAYTGVISVGATTAGGSRISYSNYGPRLFCAAHTGIQTIDAPGDYGYKSSGSNDPRVENYNAGFTGTSASCPFAATQVAMLLAYKPGLTEQQVKLAIMESSDKSGGYNYVEGKSLELGYGQVQMRKLLDWSDGYTPPAPKHNFTLIVSSVSTAKVGEVINIHLTARTNQPSLPEVQVPVKLWWSANSIQDSSDLPIGTFTAVLGGSKGEHSWSMSFAVPSGFGNRVIIAKIDPDNTYLEPVETDNQYSVNVMVPEPEAPEGASMVATELRAYVEVANIGGVVQPSIFLNYRMKNTGTVTITSMAFGKGLTPTLPVGSSSAISPIAPGQYGQFSRVRITGDVNSPYVYCQIQKLNGGVVNQQVVQVPVER